MTPWEARARERELHRWWKSEGRKPKSLRWRSGEDEVVVRHIKDEGKPSVIRGGGARGKLSTLINAPIASRHSASSRVMHTPPLATSSKGVLDDGSP
jgi:hypothetical protein